MSNTNDRDVVTGWRVLFAVASFLLGFGSVFWWQRQRDEALLRQMMDDVDDNHSPDSDDRST